MEGLLDAFFSKFKNLGYFTAIGADAMLRCTIKICDTPSAIP